MSPIALPLAELKPALTGLGKLLNRHSTLAVLGHLKIERTPDGWVALTATDLDTSATVRLEQPSAGEPLSLLVPYGGSAIQKACEVAPAQRASGISVLDADGAVQRTLTI